MNFQVAEWADVAKGISALLKHTNAPDILITNRSGLITVYGFGNAIYAKFTFDAESKKDGTESIASTGPILMMNGAITVRKSGTKLWFNGSGFDARIPTMPPEEDLYEFPEPEGDEFPAGIVPLIGQICEDIGTRHLLDNVWVRNGFAGAMDGNGMGGAMGNVEYSRGLSPIYIPFVRSLAKDSKVYLTEKRVWSVTPVGDGLLTMTQTMMPLSGMEANVDTLEALWDRIRKAGEDGGLKSYFRVNKSTLLQKLLFMMSVYDGEHKTGRVLVWSREDGLYLKLRSSPSESEANLESEYGGEEIMAVFSIAQLIKLLRAMTEEEVLGVLEEKFLFFYDGTSAHGRGSFYDGLEDEDVEPTQETEESIPL